MNLSKVAFYAVVAASLTACGGASSLGGLDAVASYTFALNSSQEVPAPKTTTATGTAQVIVYPSSIDYQVNASAITGVTMVHIHNGAAGVAGPIVVTLYQPATATGIINGQVTSGTITQASLPAGVTFESLKTLILNGNAYINIHTAANPSGELRGQIR